MAHGIEVVIRRPPRLLPSNYLDDPETLLREQRRIVKRDQANHNPTDAFKNASNESNKGGFPFCDLPHEIRLLIYAHLFGRNPVLRSYESGVDIPNRFAITSILQVCRFFYLDALPALYSAATQRFVDFPCHHGSLRKLAPHGYLGSLREFAPRIRTMHIRQHHLVPEIHLQSDGLWRPMLALDTWALAHCKRLKVLKLDTFYVKCPILHTFINTNLYDDHVNVILRYYAKSLKSTRPGKVQAISKAPIPLEELRDVLSDEKRTYNVIVGVRLCSDPRTQADIVSWVLRFLQKHTDLDVFLALDIRLE